MEPVRVEPVRHRSTAVATAALVALVAVGCGPERTLPAVPDQEVGTPETTPFIEPVSPPAEEVERPDEPPEEEGGVPPGDEIGSEDGEEGGATDE